MSDASAALAEAQRMWEEYQRQYQNPQAPSGTAASDSLYQRLSRGPAAPYIEGAAGAFQGAMEGLGALGHAASIPARAIAGAAAHGPITEGGGTPYSVTDYALYGFDPETGGGAALAGDLLASSLEESGEIAPGGVASKLVSLIGNALTDPMTAVAVLSSAEAAGTLGRSSAPPPAPRRFGPPRSKMHPSSGAMPSSTLEAPRGPAPTTTQPLPMDATQPVPRFTDTQPMPMDMTRPVPRFTDTQPVPMDVTQPVPRFTDTQPVPTMNPAASLESRFAEILDQTKRMPSHPKAPKAPRRLKRGGSIESKAKEAGMTKKGGELGIGDKRRRQKSVGKKKKKEK